jgi:hypothetical protein
MKLDQQQHDGPAGSVVAQRYSSGTSSLRCSYRDEILLRILRMLKFQVLIFLSELRKSEIG